MIADPLHDLHVLTRSGLPPEDLIWQAATLISHAVHADWAGLLMPFPGTHAYQVLSHRPDLSTALLAYLDQRTRSIGPLGLSALTNTHPTYIDHYPSYPDAKHGAVLLGVNAAAHLPLARHRDHTYVMALLRTTATPTITRHSPWTHHERAFIDAATRTVQLAIP